jgi:hypothetical protein
LRPSWWALASWLGWSPRLSAAYAAATTLANANLAGCRFFGSDDLRGVTCVSASDCWAVGFFGNPIGPPLIERERGTGWTTVRGGSSSA